MPEVTSLITSIDVWSKRAAKTGVGNAPQFLQNTRYFLLRPDLESITKPILDRLNRREIFPSQAIPVLYEALIKHDAKTRLEKAAKKQVKAKERKILRFKKLRPFVAYVFGDRTLANPDGVLKAMHRCSRGNDAESWAIRFLSEHSGCDYYATIESRTEKTKLRIERLDAIARMYRKKAAAASVPTVRVSADRLSFGVGGQYNKPVYFSRG